MRCLIVLAMIPTVLLATGTDLARAQTPPAEGIVPGEILVKFNPGTSEAKKKEVHGKKGGQTEEVIPEIGVEVVQVSSGQEESRAADYETDPNVQYAEPNGLYQAFETKKEATSDATTNMTPTDSKVGKQWAYNNTGDNGWKNDADIDAFEAWDITTGSDAVPIAILDTGIDQKHEDLRGKVTKSVNCTTKAPCDSNLSAKDKNGHGTHVAGTAAALTNNGTTGVAGTCPSCTLYNVKVLGSDGNGSWASVAKGIRWSADNGAKVINMSLGGSTGSSTVSDAVNYAWSKGVVLTAAGNDGSKKASYPAYYEHVIAVAASDYYDKKAGFSNYGSWVDVAAPGVDILSTTRDGGYGTMSGTSMATPHVAGVAGLVWSTSSGTSNKSVRDKIESTADKIGGTGSYWSKGRINACKAVGGSCKYG